MTGKRGPPSGGRNTKVLRRMPSRIGTIACTQRAPLAASVMSGMVLILGDRVDPPAPFCFFLVTPVQEFAMSIRPEAGCVRHRTPVPGLPPAFRRKSDGSAADRR